MIFYKGVCNETEQSSGSLLKDRFRRLRKTLFGIEWQINWRIAQLSYFLCFTELCECRIERDRQHDTDRIPGTCIAASSAAD